MCYIFSRNSQDKQDLVKMAKEETQQPKLQYESLEIGYELPPVTYEISAEGVSKYLEAVDEPSNLYHQPHNLQALTGLVPPMAIVAYTMAALSQHLLLPPGTIHAAQQIEFLKALTVGAKLTCQAKVSRKQERSNLRLLTIDLSTFDQNRDLVLLGKTSFVFPKPNSRIQIGSDDQT